MRTGWRTRAALAATEQCYAAAAAPSLWSQALDGIVALVRGGHGFLDVASAGSNRQERWRSPDWADRQRGFVVEDGHDYEFHHHGVPPPAHGAPAAASRPPAHAQPTNS